MPLKVWAPLERLTAGDLNANFALLANVLVAGAMCSAGAAKSVPANTVTELNAAAPAAGNDMGGFWNAPTSRLVIPANLGGMYALMAAVNVTGGAKTDQAYVYVNGMGTGQAKQTFVRTPVGAGAGATITQLGRANAGAILQVFAWSETVGDFTVAHLTLVRLGTLGVY